MKKIITWLTIFSFVSYVFPLGRVSAQPPTKTENKKIFLAVLELDNKGGLTDQECSLLSDTVRQEMFSTGRYRVVGFFLLSPEAASNTACSSKRAISLIKA